MKMIIIMIICQTVSSVIERTEGCIIQFSINFVFQVNIQLCTTSDFKMDNNEAINHCCLVPLTNCTSFEIIFTWRQINGQQKKRQGREKWKKQGGAKWKRKVEGVMAILSQQTIKVLPSPLKKAHTSQRPKWPELILVSSVWSMPRSIAAPPWTGC